MIKGVILAIGSIVFMCLGLTVAKKKYRALLYIITTVYLLAVIYFTWEKTRSLIR